jgi:hypothetical protein
MLATKSRNLLFFAPFLLIAAGLFPRVALAQLDNQKDATVGLYLAEASGRFNCSKVEPMACDDENIRVTGELNLNYFVFLCVFKADAGPGVSGVQCGIRYDDQARQGVDVFSWTSCADMEWPQDGWPNRSGDGNTIVWLYNTNCQRNEPGGFGDGVTAVAGYFSVTAYSPDKFEIVEGSADEVVVVDCGKPEEDQLPANSYLDTSHWGWVGFSDDESIKGSLPCLKRVTEDATWSRVKTLYNR